MTMTSAPVSSSRVLGTNNVQLQWNAEARSSITAVCTVVNGVMNKLEPRTTEWNQSLYKAYTWSILNSHFSELSAMMESVHRPLK